MGHDVNGIETDEDAPEYELYPGDVVQWDLRYWYVTLDVRATVGAFPQMATEGRAPWTATLLGMRMGMTPCASPSLPA